MTYLRHFKSVAIYISIAALISCLALVPPGDGVPGIKLETELYFCHFELPRRIKEMNASFSIIYSFRVDEKGSVYNIVELHDRFVGQEIVASCLEKWKFYGLDQDSTMILTANWNHGVGWTEMSVVGGGIKQKIGRHGDLSPYSY